ncbi:MAG: CHAP domain-containing protein [Clostridia bacterium]|nr:CHAP domain-containing protein [Clostridia bacterium]
MEKEIKRFISAFIAVIMLMCAFPITYKAHALTQREKIAEIALGEVGVSGRPNKYTYWYGSSGGSYSYAWCGAFVSWCAAQAGVPQSVIKKSASAVCNSFGTPYYSYKSSSNVRAGDILYVKNNVSLHVGIVVEVTRDYIYTVEGNMSDSVKKVCYIRSSGYTEWSSSYEWQKILYYGVPQYADDIAGEICGTAYYNGNKYVVYGAEATWSKAKKLCENLGGQLAVITSAKENSVVSALVMSCGKSCWIGAADSENEGKWKWVNSSPFKYKSWADGQPDNGGKGQDYAYINGETGKWMDAASSTKIFFVCEYENAVKLQNSFYDPVSNHTYEYYAEAMTWDEAKKFCAYKGGHLLTVATVTEQNAIHDFIVKNKKSVWTGGILKNGSNKWSWATGEVFDYTNWNEAKIAANKKAGTFVEICADGMWNEAASTKRQGFICEYDHTHRYNNVSVKAKATQSKSGTLLYKCACGHTSTKSIAKISSIKLSSTTLVYNAKVRTPTVTVKNSSGKALTKDKDYTVIYSSGRKTPGKYKVTVKFKGKYSGSKTLEFKIIPEKPVLTTASPGKEKVSLKWKASRSVSGYEVWYYSRVSGGYQLDGTTTKTGYTFSDLTSGRIYKLKIRAYKTVNGVKYYSAFSNTKKVKAK